MTYSTLFWQILKLDTRGFPEHKKNLFFQCVLEHVPVLPQEDGAACHGRLPAPHIPWSQVPDNGNNKDRLSIEQRHMHQPGYRVNCVHLI